MYAIRSYYGLTLPALILSAQSDTLLDNGYLIQRAFLQIQEDLPAGFYRQLPALACSGRETPPRILDLARGLLAASHP